MSIVVLRVGSGVGSGISLATNFTLHATGWSDPEADLPLTYTYYANSLLLDEGLESPALRVRLPILCISPGAWRRVEPRPDRLCGGCRVAGRPTCPL